MVTVVTVTERIYGYSCNRVTVTVCHRVTGSKTAPYYRLPIPKRLFAYTQTVVRLYANLNGTFLHEQLILNIEKRALELCSLRLRKISRI
jgi:hypothetical protein